MLSIKRKILSPAVLGQVLFTHFWDIAREALIVSIVEEGQQTVRRVVENYFQEKEREVPLLCQKILKGRLTLEQAANLFCSREVITEAADLVKQELKQQFGLAYMKDGLSDYAHAIQPFCLETAEFIKNAGVEKVLFLTGGWCYEAIMEKFFPVALLKGCLAGNLWDYLCEPFAFNYTAELEKRLTGLLGSVKTRISHDLSQALAQTVYSAFDAFQEEQAYELAS